METITVNGIKYTVENDCVRISGYVEIRLRREIRKELNKFLTSKYSIIHTLKNDQK